MNDSRMLSWKVKLEQRFKDSEPQEGMTWRKILTKTKKKGKKEANENIADIYAVPETMTS